MILSKLILKSSKHIFVVNNLGLNSIEPETGVPIATTPHKPTDNTCQLNRHQFTILNFSAESALLRFSRPFDFPQTTTCWTTSLPIVSPE
jgi:hypothetical protein